MNDIRLAAIVEGHGETEALPILIRRVAAEVDPGLTVEVRPVLRVPASRLRKGGELERSVELAARKLQARGGIFVLLDCDWDDAACPAREGPSLLDRARAARSDLPISVVLAKREFEAWFIAAAGSLRGKRGLREDVSPAANPEEIRGAKEWLSERMPRARPYAETTDRPALTELFDMALARRRADSFDKCYREIVGLLQALRGEGPESRGQPA